jgi:hypothetical protein
MATFSPPTDNFVSPVIAGEFMNGQYLAATERLANQWGKHVALSPRGRNVFLLTNKHHRKPAVGCDNNL